MKYHTNVIPFPVSAWSFFDYSTEIEDWCLGLSEEAEEIFQSLLKTNSKTSTPDQWLGCKMLQGECKSEGIWEWRFYADGRQQRVLGIFGEERKVAILLIGCSHKQRIYQPANCLDTAVKRAKEVRNGRAKLIKRAIRSDF